MNVARKSTTKLPQKWQQDQKVASREDEADSGIASTDSTDSFQDALLNLKALSGSGDMADSDRSEVKEAQRSSAAHKVQNGDSHDRDAVSKENAEDRDILEQIDDIVNSAKTADGKADQGSEDEDDVLIIKDDEAKESGKESNGISKVKNVPTKNPLRIGDKVRSTVHSIMSKLVQSNPDVNSLLSKTKSEDCADSGDSRGASPVPPRPDKGNLFDKFDVSERDSKSSLTASTSKPLQQSSSDKEDEGLQEVTAQVVNEDSEGEKCIVEETSVDSSRKEQTVDGCADGNASLENPRKDSIEADIMPGLNVDSDNLKSDSREVTVETKCDSVKKVDSSPQSDPIIVTCVDKKDTDSCSKEEKKLTNSQCDNKPLPSSSDTGSSECENEGGVSKSEEMDTSDQKSCDKVTGKVSICDSVEDNSVTERKRPLEDVQLESESSQPPKRSRLDEVIGKLGERVTFTSGIDSYDYEDSPLGDTDSIEKQSEEISGSTSDEEEDKSASDSKSKKISLTQQELETLVMATAKKAVEQYHSTEVLALNRRLEELMETQEEWRQKAKDLERQVLDLTVLQQRLEKRKAHAAALKSITTRSIGIWVTEDKFLKGITPQKHPGNRTPPATPPTTTPGQPSWATNSQSGVRSLVSEPSVSVSNGIVSVGLSVPSRNTSVAHLLSQTARMPTVASCQAANRSTAANRSITTGPRLSGSSTILAGSQNTNTSTPLARGHPSSSVTPTSSLVLVSAVPGLPMANKTVPTPKGGATTAVTPAGSAQVKVIDLTVEDDGAPKQIGKVVNSGPVRTMVPQQVVRQITPASQTMPGVPSSAILLSSPAGTQIVNASNIQRPGMLQVVTIANAQSIRPGSIFTVMPGQTGSVVRPPATAATFTTSARGPSPLVMAQPMSAGVTFVRPPPTILGNSANMRPSLAAPAAGATTIVSTARAPVGLTTAQPHVAAAAASGPVQPVGTSPSVLPTAAKKNFHPAPLPEHIRPKGLPADLKPPPPCPGLKISRVKQGIVLSWNMSIPSDCVEIASYQLFAYQETSAAPQTSLWKKVGDVKALPLPMACTLTQFQDGNKYHFAVRAIDVHGRSGAFSDPSFIFLTKAA